jgi:hypothetical protein
MEKYVKIYRGKVKVAENVGPHNIGLVIAHDLERHFINCIGTKKYGEAIMWSMQKYKTKEWELYIEDVGLPTYRIVPQK